MPRAKERLVYRMKKNDLLALDDIYLFSGLWASDWWEPVNDTDSCGGLQQVGTKEATHASGETVRITRDITIAIERTCGPSN